MYSFLEDMDLKYYQIIIINAQWPRKTLPSLAIAAVRLKAVKVLIPLTLAHETPCADSTQFTISLHSMR